MVTTSGIICPRRGLSFWHHRFDCVLYCPWRYGGYWGLVSTTEPRAVRSEFNATTRSPQSMLIAWKALLAMMYISLHLLAARKDYPLYRHRACQHPVHSWAVITARIDIVCWSIALVAVACTLARTSSSDVPRLRVIQIDLVTCVSVL